MSGRAKTAVILLIFMAVCTVVSATGLSLYVNSSQGRELLLRKINATIPGAVTVAHHHLSLFSGEILFEDLTIRDPQGIGLAGFDSLAVNLSLVSLLRKVLVIEVVDLKRPWTRLSIDEEGRLNILKALTATSAAENTSNGPSVGMPFNIILRQINLSGGQLHFTRAMNGVDLKLHDVNLTASGNLGDQSGVLKLKVGESQVVFNGYQSDFRYIDLALALSNGHLEPLIIKTENQLGAMLIYGDIHRVFSDLELDLNLSADFSLAAVESFFHLDRGDTGYVQVNLNAKGSPGNPRVNLKAEYQGGKIAGHAVDRMHLGFRLEDREAIIDGLTADTGFGRLGLSGHADLRGVFPEGFLSSRVDWEKAAYEGRLQTVALDLAAIIPSERKASGKLDATLRLKGTGTTLGTLAADAAVEIAIDTFGLDHMAQPVHVQSRAAGRMRDGTLWLDSAEVEAAGTRVSAGGNLDLDTEQMDARFRVETDGVAPLLALFGMSRIQGALTVEGNVSGRAENPEVAISASGEAIRVQGIEIGQVGLKARLNKAGQLTVNSLTVENQGSSLQAEGVLQLFGEPYKLHREMPLNARLVMANVEYNDFFKGLDIGGSLGGNLVLVGNIQSLQASADVYAKGLKFEQLSIGEVAGAARFNDGTFFLDSLLLTNAQSYLKAEGEIALLRKGSWQAAEDPTFRLTLSEGRVFMEDFSDKLSGKLALDAEFSGSLAQPRGSLNLNGQNLDLGLQRIDSVAVKLKTGNGGVIIEPLDIVLSRGGKIEGRGQVGYDHSYQFRVHSKNLSVDNFDSVRELKIVNGKLDFDISGKGFLQRPEIKGSALLKNIQIRNETIDDAALNFDFKDGRVILSGRHAFDLDAEYDLSSKAYFLNLILNDTSLTPWFVIAGRKELSGSVGGRIEAKGMAGTLEGTQALVDIHNLGIEFKGEPFMAIKELRATLSQQIFNIPGFQVELLDQGHFFVKGAGDILGPVSLDVEGDIPLKAANLLVRDLPEIKGVLSLKTSVAGTLKEPELNGEIMIEQGGVFIPELQQELHSLSGRAALSSTGEIDGYLNGMLDSGRFEVQTTIELEGFLPRQIEARITAAALPLQIPNTLEMLLNTDLSVRGTPEKLVVAGDVVLLEGTYYKDFKLNLLQAIQEEKREERPQKVESPYPYLKPLRFDIHLKYRQPFLVDNNIAYMEISPDVMLRGTPENPIITGSAKVDNGAITYLRNEFIVQRGAVDFVNPYETAAEIDIKGEVEVREWRITISLYGPPDRLTVDLSSSPPEEDADIISLLVFKKTTYELNTGSSGAGQSPTVLLTQLLASSFGEDIKESTGIDILEVEAESAEDRDSTDRIRVTVGKDLSERMTVKYSVETKDGGYVQRASTEYKLFEYFLVSGFQDTKGVYGGELIFRLEFRLFQ